MPRIRTVKPSFWTSTQVVQCSIAARLLFIGLWNFCDDDGIHPADPLRLKMEVLPADDIDTAPLTSELEAAGLIERITANGKQFWRVTGWHHQKIDKPSKMKWIKDSSSPRLVVGEHSPLDRDRDKEGDKDGDSSSPPLEPQPPQKQKRAPKQTNPDIKTFIDWWYQTFLAKFGTPYVVSGGKDGQAVKRLLGTHSLENLQEYAKTFFETPNEFTDTAGFTIGVFQSQINKIAGGQFSQQILPRRAL